MIDGKNENLENLDLDSCKDPQKRAGLLERLHFILMGWIFLFFFKFSNRKFRTITFRIFSKISKKKEKSLIFSKIYKIS